MKLKAITRIITLMLLICLIAGASLFFYNANHSYTINSGFTPLNLNFNPDTSTSIIDWQGVEITVHDGFVKGIQKNGPEESLLIRALSPFPFVELENTVGSKKSIRLNIENINPDTYATNLNSPMVPTRIKSNVLGFILDLGSREKAEIQPVIPADLSERPLVILGDNRDGYETFDSIIRQVNAVKPVLVIDNGDLVFSGKPNQYRLFDQMISGISTTVCMTLGNHDIRGNGRDTYTMLYGPAYYSFNIGDVHYVFLDSSRGYAEMQAIPDEQMAWLERDLQKVHGKTIYVFSHVPPTDPRSDIKPNNIETYTDQVKRQGGFIERKLEAYSIDSSIDHGYRTRQEAERFENLMSAEKVETVFLSHIHSYFDFTKKGVRYIISGGAGAELMTQGSYYHYLVAKQGHKDLLTMVQLPSPGNLILQRYGATVVLFATAIFQENKTAVSLILAGSGLFILLALFLMYQKFKAPLSRLMIVLKETGRFMVNRSRDLRK